MSKQQRPWDKYEAAILLDAVLKVQSGEIDRKQAISDVSKKLRLKAQISGYRIDEKYRNIAGITFQMHSMESAIAGHTIVKPASKLFNDVVKMMNENKAGYNKLLDEANKLTEKNELNNEEEFYKWLSKQVSLSKIPEFISIYKFINDYFLERGVLVRPLLETTKKTTLSQIYKTIEDNVFFRLKYKNQINKMSEAIHYYVSFLINKKKIERETIVEEAKIDKDDEREELQNAYQEATQNHNEEKAIEKTEEEQINVSASLDVENRKSEFAEWLISTGLSTSTVRPYVSSLAMAGRIAEEAGILSDDIFAITDPAVLKNALNSLLNNTEFVEANKIRHNQIKTAWKKYIYFSGDKSIYDTSDGTIGSHADSSNTDLTLYFKLKSMAQVYESGEGYDIQWILDNLGMQITEEYLKEYLAHTHFAVEIKEGIYSFCYGFELTDVHIEYDKESYIKVLLMRYPNGMQLDSIDLENFRDTYSDIIGEEIDLTDKALEICLRKSGVFYNNRIFPAEGIIKNDIKEKLLEYVRNNFRSGNKVLYYKAIFSDFSDDFQYCFNLTDANMLRPYLEFVCDSEEFYFYDEFMSTEKNKKVDHSSEIEDFMLKEGRPLSYDEMYAGLSHISKEVIHSEIKSNHNYLLNEKEHYFHIDIFEISSEEIDKITEFIKHHIDEDGYCIWSHVYEEIKVDMPIFIENNVYLSSLGIRNAVSRMLSDSFEFGGEVISNKGESLNMNAVFRLYGEHHAPFSDEDVYDFSKLVSGGSIYFDGLSVSSVRVSKNLFVSKNNITFDTGEIDKAIETYLPTGYLPIKDIDSFLVFPNVGYEWNVFLLESYLMFYSSKYALVNNGRSLNNVAGAVVKKGTGWDDYFDVCADMLANSECILNKNKALDFLSDMNMLTRKSYTKIEDVLVKAKQIRNKKG